MSQLDFLSELGIDSDNLGGYSLGWHGSGGNLESIAPTDSSTIASVKQCSSEDYDLIIANSEKVFRKWRMEPAPRRGEVVRLLLSLIHI